MNANRTIQINGVAATIGLILMLIFATAAAQECTRKPAASSDADVYETTPQYATGVGNNFQLEIAPGA